MFGFKNVRFKETLWINLLRGAAAGVVWMTILFVANLRPGVERMVEINFIAKGNPKANVFTLIIPEHGV